MRIQVSASYDDSIKLWMDSGDDDWVCVQVRLVAGTASSVPRLPNPCFSVAQTLAGPPHGHESTVWALAFRHDGSFMASCSDDKTVKIWSAQRDERGKPAWRHALTLSGHHSRPIFSIDWSRAGALATASGDNALRVFRERPGNDGQLSFEVEQAVQDAHEGDINCVRFSPKDPTLLATAGDDGLVKLWRVQD